MARAFVSLIVILILAGVALALNGLLGTEPGHRLASRCSFSAETGRSCQTGRSGYGIDDVALNQAPLPAVAPDPKARKRSATVKAAAEGAEATQAVPAPAVTNDSAPASRVPVAATPEAAKPVEVARPVDTPAPVREASAWKDPVAPLEPAPAAKPTVAGQAERTTQAEPARPAEIVARDVAPKPAEPKRQVRPEPVRTAQPSVAPSPEPRVRTAEPKANVSETRRVAEAPRVRHRVVTRSAKVREPVTEVASVSPPTKPLDVAPARRLDLVTESRARRVVIVPRRIARAAPPPVAEEAVRVGVASAALVPPRPIPDRSSGSSAFPSDFQAALRHYNARYSMYSARRAPWSSEDD